MTISIDEQYTDIKLFNKRYASQCIDRVPLGWWIDKSTGNCGLTYLALTDKNDCIIIMPRTQLVDDKLSQKTVYKNILGVSAGVSAKDVEEYIKMAKKESFPIKIATTYDSFAMGKMDFLLERPEIGILVDECQFLPELAKKDIKLSRALHNKLKANIERVSFFSAHPPKREYMPEYIQNMPSVKYYWLHQIEATPYIYDTKRPYSTVAKILKKMIENGEFELQDGIKFRKAIVFVNSVSAIADIAETINQPYNVGYIVGNSVKNSVRLNQIATEITDKSNLPLITLGTSSMLAGIDLRDTETFNIIVSTTSKEWTLFDTELDIPQAITRQRLDDNPHNNKFLFIYSKDDYESKIEALEDTYNNDVKRVNIAVSNINVLMKNNQEISDAFEKYDGHYYIENDSAVIDFSLLNLAKYRVKELFRQYKEGFAIMGNKKEIKKLKVANIKLNNSYQDYAEMVIDCKSKSELVTVLKSVKNKDWCKYLEYGITTRKILTNFTEAVNHYNNRLDYESIVLHVRNTFKIGEFYSNAVVKDKLGFIYKKKELKRTAKAIDLLEFAEVKKQMITVNGKRTEGLVVVNFF